MNSGSDKRQSSTIVLDVDVTNPGQFFACCGLLELANRLWPAAEGWFCEDGFTIHGTADGEGQFREALASAPLANTMTSEQLGRREALAQMGRKALHAKGLVEEKKLLDRLYREEPVTLGPPFNLRIDWFLDKFAGGSTFKTWAGQQSVIEIARAMHTPLADDMLPDVEFRKWLKYSAIGLGCPFNIDSSLGAQGSDLDIGFSFDPLVPVAKNLTMYVRPLTELFAFIGLQRFRPSTTDDPRVYQYRAWRRPLCANVASAVCAGAISVRPSADYAFRLLYRTKYLKSFLPANLTGVYQ